MTSSSSGRLRVQCFGLSLDGYGAGPNQSIEHPLGVGIDLPKLGYQVSERVVTDAAMHVVLTKHG